MGLKGSSQRMKTQPWWGYNVTLGGGGLQGGLLTPLLWLSLLQLQQQNNVSMAESSPRVQCAEKGLRGPGLTADSKQR